MTEVPTELQELDAPQYATLSVDHQRPTLGPVRVDIAAYAAVVVTTIFAYLAWVAGVVAPVDVISGTVATLSGAAGFIWPNNAA